MIIPEKKEYLVNILLMRVYIYQESVQLQRLKFQLQQKPKEAGMASL